MTDNEIIREFEEALRKSYNTIAKQKEEIERLKAEYNDLVLSELKLNKTFMDFVNKEKSEAIKEFAERLKTKVNIDLCEAINCSDYLYDFPKLVDNLVKEMVGTPRANTSVSLVDGHIEDSKAFWEDTH